MAGSDRHTDSLDEQPQALSSRRTWLTLAVIVALGASMRCWQIGEPLWVDELHTAWTVSDGLSAIAPRAAMGNQSPVYFWLPWLTTRLLGPSEFSLRLPSLLAGTALMLVMFFAVRRWTAGNPDGSRNASRCGLFAAALVAVDATSLFYATEARSFALVQLLGVVHVLLFDAALERTTWVRRTALITLGGLLFHLHYTAGLLFLAEAAWYAVCRLRRARLGYTFRQLAVDALLLAAICALAWPVLREIAERRDNWRQFVGTPGLLAPLTLLPLWIFVLLPVAFLAASEAVGWAGVRLFKRTGEVPKAVPAPTDQDPHDSSFPATPRNAPSPHLDGGHRDPAGRLLLIANWFFVPVLSAWLLTRLDIAVVFYLRYLVVVSPAPFAFAALGLGFIPRRMVQLATVITVLVASVAWGGLVDQFRHDGRFVGSRHEDWRGAVAYLEASPDAAACPVLVYAGLIEAEDYLQANKPLARPYAMLPVLGLYRVDDRQRPLIPITRPDPPLSARERQAILEAQCVYLVTRLPVRRARRWESGLIRSLARAETRATVVERREFGTVTVSRLHIAPLPRPESIRSDNN